MNIVRTDSFLIEGDSISDPAYPYQIWLPTMKRIVGNYANPTGASYRTAPPTYPTGGLRAPVFVNCAISGSTTVELLARLDAELAANHFTALLIHQGINDGAAIRDATMTIGQFNTNVTSIINKCTAAGITKILWAGPLCNGEKYPTGQNDALEDPSIEAIDSSLTTLIPSFATGGVTAEYVSLRQAVYAIQEPLLNTLANGYADPPGSTNGPLCTPLISPSTINGLHPNATGRKFCTVEIAKKIVFT